MPHFLLALLVGVCFVTTRTHYWRSQIVRRRNRLVSFSKKTTQHLHHFSCGGWTYHLPQPQFESAYPLRRTHLALPRADYILAQNLKGWISSSAAPIETIQPTGDRQNTRLSFSCRINRHPVTFTKRFTRTDESSRNIGCPIRFML